MSDEWDSSEETSNVRRVVPLKKWQGEDEDANSAPDDWEESSGEEEEKPASLVRVAPPKKKGTLKAKLAEKEATKALQKAQEVDDELQTVIDPAEKKRLDQEREVKADMANAADLFGPVALTSSSSSELKALLTFNPRTKEDFNQLSINIIELITKQHENKPLYAAFVESHVRALAQSLRDVDVRKAASGLTTLANEKQKEQREKASGKKRSKAATKPTLGSAKVSNKLDTSAYDESLDDFGANDDFM